MSTLMQIATRQMMMKEREEINRKERVKNEKEKRDKHIIKEGSSTPFSSEFDDLLYGNDKSTGDDKFIDQIRKVNMPDFQEDAEIDISDREGSNNNVRLMVKEVQMKQTTGNLKEENVLKKLGGQILPKQLSKVTSLNLPVPASVKRKLKRVEGYEKVSIDVQRWQHIVNKMRRSETLNFPLENPSLRVMPVNALPKPKETTLEKKVTELLMGAKLDRKLPETEEEKEKREAVCLELIKARNHQRFYERRKQERTEKKNKLKKMSKSRTYHRLLRQDKLRQEKSEFEKMKLMNPEKAIEMLDELDMARIKERATLRHKRSKWLLRQRGKSYRDPSVRDALDQANQLRLQLMERMNQMQASLEAKEAEEQMQSDDEPDSDVRTLLMQQSQAVRKGLYEPTNAWVSQLALPKDKEKDEAELEMPFHQAKKYWQDIHDMKQREQDAQKVVEKMEDEALNEEKNEKEEIVEKEELDNGEKEGTKKKRLRHRQTKHEKRKRKRGEDDIEQEAKKSKKETDDKTEKLEELKKMRELWTDEGKTDKIEEEMECDNDNESNQNDDESVQKEKKKVQFEEGTKTDNLSDSVKKSLGHSFIDEMFDSIENNLKKNVESRIQELETQHEKKREIMTLQMKAEKKAVSILKAEERKKNEEERKVLDYDTRMEGCDEGRQIVKTMEDIDRHLSSGPKEAPKEVAKDSKSTPFDTINVKDTDVAKLTPRAIGGAKSTKADDDVIEDLGDLFEEEDNLKKFSEEKKEHETEERRKNEFDLFMDGWGSWGGPDIKVDEKVREKFKKRVEITETAFSHLDNVIYNEDSDVHENLRKHMVSRLPYHFASITDYEASIRQPMGRNFVPETTHKDLIKSRLTIKKGGSILPMGEEALVKDRMEYEEKNESKHKYKKKIKMASGDIDTSRPKKKLPTRHVKPESKIVKEMLFKKG